MKNMRLAAKLTVGFGLLVALALCLGGMAVWQMGKVGRVADDQGFIGGSRRHEPGPV
jgi:CHASE3 domain sensor protein